MTVPLNQTTVPVRFARLPKIRQFGEYTSPPARTAARNAVPPARGTVPEQKPNNTTLLLQGPMGPLFRLLGQELSERGVTVWRINLNLADVFDWRSYRCWRQTVSYRGTRSQWSAFIEKFLIEKGVTTLCLFDDCRPYHADAIAVARRLGIRVQVVEAGYFRPDHITIEPDGVQANSRLPRDPEFYRAQPDERPESWIPIGSTFASMAFSASVYFLLLWISAFFYPHYRHHKAMPWYKEMICGIRSWIRSLTERFHDREVMERIVGQHPYFVVPLQVFRDQQISHHSDYDDVADFIDEVVTSFSKYASAGDHLILKHHPMDRGYRNYSKLISRLSERHGTNDRIHYVVDAHLPTLLRHAQGTITINSTAGIASLHHGTPVHVMGRCFYAMDGLAQTGALDGFWKAPGQVDENLYRRFRAFLLQNRQINGSLYGAFHRTPAIRHLAEVLTGVRPVWSAESPPDRSFIRSYVLHPVIPAEEARDAEPDLIALHCD